MWLALLVLFVVLSPGVLFTLPALGKKMGGKFVIALMHSLLFVVVVALLNVTEAFQVFQVQTPAKGKVVTRFTPEQTLANAEKRLNDLTTSLESLKAQVTEKTRELDEGNSRVAQLRQQLQEAQQSAQAAQNKVNMKNEELSNAQKEVLDTTARMNMITNKIAASTSLSKAGIVKGGVNSVAVTQQQLNNLNRSINSTNASIVAAQKAVSAARLSLDASNNVKQAEQAPASMDSGSKVQDVAQAAEVAQKAQVDAEKAVIVANKAPVDATPAAPAAVAATPTIASMLGLGPKTISMEGDPSPTPPPPQRMPADLCTPGNWPILYNGRNDGTGPNTYTTVCMNCATRYAGNPNIPVNINQQNYANYKYTC
jgi:peptidoglycan hydrolase CwlO-like protein